ncbi:MAG: DUF1016 domain-containing protein [Bacteroides sp.]|nr:DUF1016 domain-containing protein [Bacteroides sp.]
MLNEKAVHLYAPATRIFGQVEKIHYICIRFFDCLSLDLNAEFPEQTGFSTTNIKYTKRWYEFYNQNITNTISLARLVPPRFLNTSDDSCLGTLCKCCITEI